MTDLSLDPSAALTKGRREVPVSAEKDCIAAPMYKRPYRMMVSVTRSRMESRFVPISGLCHRDISENCSNFRVFIVSRSPKGRSTWNIFIGEGKLGQREIEELYHGDQEIR